MPRNFVPDNVLDQLIDLVRQNPAIFYPSRKDHKDAIKITNTWNSIADILKWEGKTGDFRRIRWRTLRDTYIRKKRENKMKTSGSGASDIKRWKFQDVMQFLDNYTEEQKSDSNLEDDSMHTDVLEPDEGNDRHNESARTLEDEDDSSLKSEKKQENKSTESSISGAKKKRSYDAVDKAFLDFCASTKQRRESTLEKDEDEAFLEPYVYCLKKMSKDVKGVVQLQIAQLFFNAENRHLPPQPIMPLPPLPLPMKPHGTQVEYPVDWHRQQYIIPNIQQCDRYPSETSDVLAVAMKELQ